MATVDDGVDRLETEKHQTRRLCRKVKTT